MALTIGRGRLAMIASILGGVLLIAAGLKYLLLPVFDLWVQVGLALGALSLAGSILLEPDRIRRALSGRQAKYGSNAFLMSIAFAGILVVINLVAYNNPQRIDLTEDREYSLSPESELLLSELSEPVQVIGFYTPDRAQSRESIRPLLDEYVSKSDGKLSYEFIDPRSDPLAADRYGITRDGSMAVLIGEASQVIEFPSEVEITSAMVSLANPESRVVYFLSGHGERDLDATDSGGLSQLRSALESKNYEVSALNLIAEGEVPGNARALVIAGPLSPLSEAEIELTRAYLDDGGALVVLHEPTIVSQVAAEEDTLAAWLEAEWGLHFRDDLVVDLNSTIPLSGISQNYAIHPITERMQNLASYYPTARSIETRESEAISSVAITPLVFTGENSWSETDLNAIAEANVIEFNPESDSQGPLTLAVTAEDQTSGARLVAVGDSDFAANADFLSLGNGDLMVNSIDWASRQEELISITPKASTQRQVVPASREAVVLLLLATVVLLPGSVVVIGVLVWWNRRKRS